MECRLRPYPIARAFNSEHQMELVNECSLRFAEDKDFRLLVGNSVLCVAYW
jgi:meiotic recombination protein DMC1